MDAKVGDRIIVESEKVGKPAREGEVLEIIDSPYGVGYRVRWEDGHETTFRPSAGSARIVHPTAAPKPRKKAAAVR